MGNEWDSPRYQIANPLERNKHMEFLLCTDGFWELIDEKKMTATLKKSKTPEEWIAQMEQEIQKNGKEKEMDNYSAIAVYID